jgi:hypothetical protein
VSNTGTWNSALSMEPYEPRTHGTCARSTEPRIRNSDSLNGSLTAYGILTVSTEADSLSTESLRKPDSLNGTLNVSMEH